MTGLKVECPATLGRRVCANDAAKDGCEHPDSPDGTSHPAQRSDCFDNYLRWIHHHHRGTAHVNHEPADRRCSLKATKAGVSLEVRSTIPV